MIKQFTISKIDNVMKIWLEENIKAHDYISENYWMENYDSVKRLLPQSEVHIYEEGNEIKGFIGIVDKSYIAGLFVLYQYHSNGIGSKLVEKCKQNYPLLRLDVYAKNLKAIKFYKKHGFIIEKEKENEDTRKTEYSMVWKW